MRIIEKVPGKNGGWAYLTKIGYSEIEMLYGMVQETYSRTPKIFEFGPARNRMKDLMTKMGDVVREHRTQVGGYVVEDYIRNPDAHD